MGDASMMGEASDKTKKTVIVTGFGPFGEHKVNTSWQCVKLLKERGLGQQVDLHIYELAVDYDEVKKRVPELWSQHKPDLVVHVGVSGMATEVTLELQAHNDGYNRKDVRGCIADQECCVSGADSCLKAGLHMANVCDIVNKAGTKAKAVTSQDAGRYLCDFSFYTSLHIDRHRSAFIHVPPEGSPHSLEELTATLANVITCMLEHPSNPDVVVGCV